MSNIITVGATLTTSSAVLLETPVSGNSAAGAPRILNIQVVNRSSSSATFSLDFYSAGQDATFAFLKDESLAGKAALQLGGDATVLLALGHSGGTADALKGSASANDTFDVTITYDNGVASRGA